MKSSTFGIGIIILVLAVGTGIRFCSTDNFGDFFSPGERQIACAEEGRSEESRSEANQAGLPVVPKPLPMAQSTGGDIPHDPWAVTTEQPRYAQVSYTKTVEAEEQVPPAEPTRLVPRQENREPEYVIRGQNPPGTLTHKEIPTPNPLRDGEEEYPVVTPQSLPKPLAQAPPPLPEPKPITQAAMQGERSPFADFPAPPSSQQDSFLDSTDFANSPVKTQEPKTPVVNSFDQPIPPSPTPARQPNQLRSADPFAAQSNTDALPPVVSKPQPPREEPARTAAPIASGHRTAIDRPAMATSDRSASFNEHSSSASTVRSSQNEGTGMPGASNLEGAQTPFLTVEKQLPAEIVIEQPATIRLRIQNTGRSTAKKITVRDQIPQGTRLLSTTPDTTPNENGELLWTLGNLDPNEQLIVEMRVLPLREGEIGSVATVNYSAEASARIMVARPMLKVDVKVPSEVRMGEIVNLEIAVSNPGTATVTGIVLVEHIPDGLYHKDGKVLENRKIESLKPKEKKVLVLPLTCTGPGNLVNHVIVTANNNLRVEEQTTIRALAPVLKLEITGPRQRFLERKATYRLVVANTGTASAENVDLKATLPKAVKFVSTNQSGVYEPQTHSVHWALEELPAQEAGEIELVLTPTQIGEHSLQFTGVGQNNLKAEDVKTMTIDGLPALSFEVVGSSNLVEVGKDVVYEIRVANKGTKSANNVTVQAALSDGMTFVKAEGAPNQSRGGVVAFSPVSHLEAKGERVFKITARCNADGDHRVTVQVVSDDLSSPITKEESTRVFQ